MEEKIYIRIPTLFVEKVRQKDRDTHSEEFFELLTYEKLIAFINNEGLAFCTSYKLKSQMKKERQDNKKALVKFCLYNGYILQ